MTLGGDGTNLSRTQPNRVDQVFDAAWEAEARATLEREGFDPDLAIAVSRDALRVLGGELSEEEFRRRHHEAYLREFGQDDRPGFPGGSSPSTDATVSRDDPGATDISNASPSAAAATAAERPTLVSRRTALRMAGAGGAALLLGDMLRRPGVGLASDDADASSVGAQAHDDAAAGPERPVRWGLVVDLERCDGCLLCVHGCRQENGLPDGVHWIYVQAYREPERPDHVNLLPRTCQHCTNGPCVAVCPTAARHVRDDGIVLIDYDRCIGCRYCQVACPYGVNYLQWTDPERYGGRYGGDRRDANGRSVAGDPPVGVMGKCTFCPLTQDAAIASGEQPPPGRTSCETACPHGVLHFGDLNDPESKPNRYLEEKRRERGGHLPTFRLLEDLGTGPNVIYIGSPPSRRAEPAEPPHRYENMGLVHERRAVLEGPEPWFLRVIRRS